MDQYPLRNIPDDLWHKVKIKALTDGVTVRDVIELALKLYDAKGIEALGGKKAVKRLPSGKIAIAR